MTKTSPRRRRSRALALALSGLGVGGAWAQEFNRDLDRQQPVRVGEAALYPSLRVDYLVDDNIGLRSEDEVDGSAVVVSPRLDFVADRRQLALRVYYAGAYSQGSEDSVDWADHELGLSVDAAFDARRRASLRLSTQRQHESLGLELTRGQGDLFDESVRSNDTRLEGRFTYGAESARGNLAAGLRLGDLSYVNLSSVTDGRDYSFVQPFAQFGYRISGATRAVIEVSFASLDFEADADDRDQVNVGAGVQFSPTGKIRGGFLLGVSSADYADAAVEDDSTFSASADLDWLVREYATIGLRLSREFDNLTPTTTVAGEGQSVRTGLRLLWDQNWSERFDTNAFVQLTDVTRACPELPTSTVSGGVEFGLSVRRWLEVGASAALSSRGADACAGVADDVGDDLDFDRTVLGVHVRVTL